MTPQPSNPPEDLETLRRERDAAQEMLNTWFSLASKTEEEVTPILLSGLKGYLKTSKNGGMPSKYADAAYDVLEDFCRLYVGIELVPVLRGIAETIAQAAAEAREAELRDRVNALAEGLENITSDLMNISDNIDNEGDRVYFGSTNDADRLGEIALDLHEQRARRYLLNHPKDQGEEK